MGLVKFHAVSLFYGLSVGRLCARAASACLAGPGPQSIRKGGWRGQASWRVSHGEFDSQRVQQSICKVSLCNS